MRALHTMSIGKELVIGTGFTPVLRGHGHARVSPAVAAPELRKAEMFKNMALFLSAPFIGLLYAILLPFVGLAALAFIGARALMAEPKVREALRFCAFAASLVAAPFIGLIYVTLYPFAALTILAWTAMKELVAFARVA